MLRLSAAADIPCVALRSPLALLSVAMAAPPPASAPYTPRLLSSSAELSSLLSPYLVELTRHSAIKPYLDVLNEIAADQQRWAADFVQCVLQAMEQVSRLTLPARTPASDGAVSPCPVPSPPPLCCYGLCCARAAVARGRQSLGSVLSVRHPLQEPPHDGAVPQPHRPVHRATLHQHPQARQRGHSQGTGQAAGRMEEQRHLRAAPPRPYRGYDQTAGISAPTA